ncbi:MAG TPA: antibiotic biosynthesis monooxygenase [Acidimicrobiales bacterium]
MKQSAAIRCVLQMQVHDLAAFRDVAARCAEFSSTEPGTLYYDWFLDEATGEARLIEGYDSYESIVAHATGPVFTEIGPELLQACTFVHMDAYGDTAELAAGPQFWPSTYWGAAIAALTG